MVKKLRYSRIDFVDRVGALMLVTFLDEDGNMYQWAPKWADVEQIFLKQINVERYNKPESEFLNKFAKTAQNVVEGAQKIESGYKIVGIFRQCSKQKLLIESMELDDKGVRYELTPGFDVTVDFLDHWLDRYVEAFVINDIVIRLRIYDSGNVAMEYPPPEEELKWN